ncbi:MAG: hypothetical protein V4492_04995 [Chlamydiota bacterium]
MSGESEETIGEEFSTVGDASKSHSTEEGSVESAIASEQPKQEVEKKPFSSLFAEFLKVFDSKEGPEAKIRSCIEFMRESLAHSGTPRFKDFWEGRKLCVPLFKENISAKVRSQLWSEYIELSTEAKRLKEILDEQSAFAVEQIELAILGLEQDLENYQAVLHQSNEVVVPSDCITLKEKKTSYNDLQRELNLLNTLASRVNALRKEVVKTEMRIRIKNKLLERLSLCGDKIFPKRKELIKTISQEFVQDVEQFVHGHFHAAGASNVPMYALREEIKVLQSIAKVLTLNTQAFTETRLKLSECWDVIKNWEKERRKETQQKREAYQQNYDLVLEKIKPFAEACMGEISNEECNRQSAEIFDFMKTIDLGRDEVRELREEVFKAKRGPQERAREIEQERQRKERDAENARRTAATALKEELTEILQNAEGMDLDALTEKSDALTARFTELAPAKAEKQIYDRLFRQLKDALNEKKEKALLNLSEDDMIALDKLNAALEERKERRQEIKNQLESYRKHLGGSGFDFEKAMMYREMIEEEKGILDKINTSIDEIEEKIAEIEGN